MATTILGRVSLVPKGEYNPNTSYKKLDIISYQGSSYLALTDMTGVVPTGDNVVTMLLAKKGDTGEEGADGTNGKSAYEIWKENGHTGTEAEFLAALKGDTGETGASGVDGENGADGTNGKSAYEIWLEAGNEGTVDDFIASLKGEKGATGKGFVVLGYYGTEMLLKTSVPNPASGDAYGVGAQAPYNIYIYDTVSQDFVNNGPLQGAEGKSAYEIWLEAGNDGAIEDFITSLKGATGETGASGIDGVNGTDGANGKSAYEIWLEKGGEGTVDDFLASLKGEKGATGAAGANGADGAAGVNGSNGLDGANGTNGANGDSAYEIWLGEGHTGTKADFLASLKGASGRDFECPTLEEVPGEETLSYTLQEVSYPFRIGELARVYDTDKEAYTFYQLYDITAQSKAVWKPAGGGIDESMLYEKILITLSSNVYSDANLNGLAIILKYPGKTLEMTWAGTPISQTIPLSVSYEITCQPLSEYVNPPAQEYTAMGGNLREIVFAYEKIEVSRIVFNKSTTDPANITGDINTGAIASILSKYRRCMTKKTAEGKVSIAFLRDNNGTLYDEDGSTATLTGNEGDVMVYMPYFCFKRTEVSSTEFAISFAEKNDGTFTDVPESLVGAYKAYNSSSKLYSRSGVAPTVSVSQANFLAYAQARGSGYQLIDYIQHCVIAFMFYAKYGTRNSQAKLGAGGALYNSNNTTGQTNALGNTDTVNNTTTYVNFLGIEGVHGGVYEFVAGVTITNYIWSIQNLDDSVRTVTAGSTGGYITHIAAENAPFIDMVPTDVAGGSATTGYADYYECTSGGPFVLLRSCSSTSTDGGVAYASVAAFKALPVL